MPPRVEHRSILLVEDNPDDRARIHRMLASQRRQYHIVDCASGTEALELLALGESRFDCMLLDMGLPDMDGDEVLRRMTVAGGRIPIAVSMLTAHDDDEVAARTIEMGAEDFLLKDEVTPYSLARSVENAVERFEIRRELEAQRAAIELRNQRLEMMRDELEARLVELSAATQSRDRFVAMMSHEMRTPLNAILGYAELLELEIEGQINDGQRRNLDRIRIGSRHLLDLINDVLDLARADARKLELDLRPVDVSAVIEEVSALLENQATQKQITLRYDIEGGLPLISADLQRFRQILMNLMGNAIKFTESGSVKVIARHAEHDRMVAIEVHDTGIGIDGRLLSDVFKEFFQAESALTRPFGGSGLGLAISQRLARAMGGDIRVESKIGTGSTFTLTLPAAREGSLVRPEDSAQHDARMARLSEPEVLPPRSEPVSVVAFSDNDKALGLLASSVAPMVNLAWTTAAADVAALTKQRMASLVILDVSARSANALEIAHALSELDTMVPPAVLLLPEIVAPRDGVPKGRSAVDLGWVALVPKPFTSEQLTRAVETAAGRPHEETEASHAEALYEVLVIDDDEDSRRVASRVLRKRGIRVRECVDGESGLVEMRLRPPDVAVLDLMMPVLDGFGVLATMRADPMLSGIPVVVLTAKTLTEAERQFLTRTAVRVLQKGEHRLGDIAALVLRAAASARGAVNASSTASHLP